jgi:hypothetical protein
MEKGLRLHRVKGVLALITSGYNKGNQITNRGDDTLPIIAKELDKQISSATVDISRIEHNPKLVITR